MSNIENEKKKQISYAKLISKDDYQNLGVVPDPVKKTLKKTGDFYLWVYIPGEDILKLSIYPLASDSISKILIRLEEFSPELIKGISEILQKLELGDNTIHTTGLCFSGENCYYETYINTASLSGKLTKERVEGEFSSIAKIREVKVIEIPLSKM